MKKKNRKKIPKKRISLREAFLSKNNLVRDIVILVVAVVVPVLFVIIHNRLLAEKSHVIQLEPSADAANEAEDPTIDTSGWKTYQNPWYGFKLKYPENLEKAVSLKPLADSKWEYKYQFRKNETDANDPYIGFDVVIYNVNNVKELTSTEEHPLFKSPMNENETCRFVPAHMRDEPAFFSVEMNIPPTDDCYKPAFFYSVISDEYIYNIVPVLRKNQKAPADLKKYAVDNFPEFIPLTSSFDLFAIKKANPKPVVLRGTACPVKVDNPSISSSKSKNHMDEDCCPDFDEWPKPGCAYTARDYVIMLKGATSGHVKSSQASKIKAFLKGK